MIPASNWINADAGVFGLASCRALSQSSTCDSARLASDTKGTRPPRAVVVAALIPLVTNFVGSGSNSSCTASITPETVPYIVDSGSKNVDATIRPVVNAEPLIIPRRARASLACASRRVSLMKNPEPCSSGLASNCPMDVDSQKPPCGSAPYSIVPPRTSYNAPKVFAEPYCINSGITSRAAVPHLVTGFKS